LPGLPRPTPRASSITMASSNFYLTLERKALLTQHSPGSGPSDTMTGDTPAVVFILAATVKL
jgi:hypothetical protein